MGATVDVDWTFMLALGAVAGVLQASYTLDRIAKRLDRVERSIDALHDYIKEVDPRHDEERELRRDLFEGDSLFAGKNHMDFVRAKRERGERTLNDPVLRD